MFSLSALAMRAMWKYVNVTKYLRSGVPVIRSTLVQNCSPCPGKSVLMEIFCSCYPSHRLNFSAIFSFLQRLVLRAPPSHPSVPSIVKRHTLTRLRYR